MPASIEAMAPAAVKRRQRTPRKSTGVSVTYPENDTFAMPNTESPQVRASA